MTDFTVRDPNYKARIIENYKIQKAMALIGAEITDIKPGYVEISCPYDEKLTQQNGYFHAGMVTTLADGAGGYAAWSLTPPDSNILAVEFKVNFISPAKGDPIIARGQVIKPGRTITVCRVDIFSVENGEEKLCAIMQQTLMRLDPK